MKALVTGASGHIGSHVVRSAIDAGMKPIAFVREKSDRRALAGLDVETRTGDILDQASLVRACEGVDVLFHVAAVYKNFTPNPDDIIKPAIEGTKNAIAAARAAGVKRLVYTSTGATMGFTPDPKRPITEDDFLETAATPYIRAKIEAEKVVREAAKSDGLEIVILNPSGVFGPRDYRIGPATRAIIGLLQGDPTFFYVGVTDVRDVGRAHVLAAEKGKHGRRYLVVGDTVSPAQVRDAYGRIAGIKPPTFAPPRFLLNFLAGRMEKQALATGGDANLTRDMLKDALGKHLAYDGSRSKSELGMTYRPAEEVIRDTIRWLLFMGALKPKVDAKVRKAMGAAAEPDADWTK